jgi:post-segregation antitoxin (ccd killing protein)
VKTEVYSWRVSRQLKSELERQARHRKVSVSSLLEEATRKWLKESAATLDDDESQRKLHAAAEKCLGAFASGRRDRAENASADLRRILRRKQQRENAI